MSDAVNRVTGVVEKLDDLAAKCDNVANKMDKHIADVDQTLGLVGNVADGLEAANLRLRSVLGIKSNFPPKD